MYSVVVAFGLASVMLCIGMAIRAKIKFFQHMLMPVSVIGGVIGFIFINLILVKYPLGGASVTDFSNIVDVFFVLSFISIGLTGDKKKKEKVQKIEETDETKGKRKKKKEQSGAVRGGIGMGLIWCILYAVQPMIGILIIAGLGKMFNMDAMYGILVPFAFCQGPGQSSTYGRLFENTYGFANAEMVALSYAVCGFLVAFLIGVPLAKYGIKKGLSKNKSKINEAVERGYYVREEQRESIGKTTFHSANIETIAAHFAVMGISYLLALVLAKIISYVPAIGESFSAMLFMWGMYAAYIVKAVMRKLKIDYLINNALQSKISGFLSDYLVVCAFMAIQVSIIGNWIIPIVITSVVVAIATVLVSMFFGRRLGSDHDFERVLGTYGTCTGTTPSGLSLIRIVDPKLQTSAGAELGIMNTAMMFSTPTMILITLAGLKMISLPIVWGGMLITILIYMILLKAFGVWRKPTFSFAKGRLITGEGYENENAYLQGTLHYTEPMDEAAVGHIIGNSMG